MRSEFRQILLLLSLLAGLVVVGTVGFRLLTDHGWVDSLYLAVVTLTTVGSRDAGKTPAAMLFVVVYLVMGLSVFSYGAFHLGQLIVNTDIRRLLEQRKMNAEIAELKGHFIICGLGRMGRAIAEYVATRGQKFVIIEREEEHIASDCRKRGWLFVVGDATDDAVLEQAGISRAQSLATTLPTDADNVYVVLSARMLSPKVQIVARASDDSAVQKLTRAGASRVISPFSSGATKMARLMLNPSVEDFLEITDDRGNDLELADVHIEEGSPYIGKKLSDTDLRQLGVMVIGIRRSTGERLLPPSGETVIKQGDSLFAFGSAAAVQKMIGQADAEAGLSS
ncbi:MAG: potassium channel protein [Planctomycetaceae bacterium]|nr:potassium channel protein [Planctomycetaceae bacterium]